ncbi:TolC family protein [Paludibaculum fermentans]|uniref:TolC family protein n=1 Tax=Paludibaculum fermentans TaxID=1473598 RepID=A0A7S7NKF3_PALFE|nr:TolC family protein [Paludibaculum fermentans]QOY85271.1 TolC family protein [Paludibaculum fermentans]
MNAAISEPTAPWIGTGNWWRKTFAANDTSVIVDGPVRLKDFVVDGKLTLSLKNYLDLVVANNTDIAVQRLTLETPKNAIQRAFGVFDPIINSSFSATRAKTPSTSTLQGANILNQLDQPFQASYQQLFAPGTQVNSTINMSKTSTNSSFNQYNPALTTSWSSSFTQPLLRNRGIYINRLPITIARAQRKTQELSLESTLQTLLVNAENAYWDVISARERLKVQEQALFLADQALKRSQKEVELGATSPLEIFQPQQNYATAEINLTQVKFQLQIAEDALRRQISVDLDPDVRKLPIVLTEQSMAAADEAPLDSDALVGMALQKRPDLISLRQTLDVNDLQIQSALNLLKPNLSLGGRYSTTGRGGTAFATDPVTGGRIPIPGGITDAFGQYFDYNTFAFSLTFNFPLRDRAASANLADTVVSKKLTALRQRSLEQSVRQDVLTAVNQLESSRASVKLAQVALDFAQKRADADQKRYDLGVITIFFLLASQNDLTQAQSTLVNSTVNYRRNVLNLQQRVGNLLEVKGIVMQ